MAKLYTYKYKVVGFLRGDMMDDDDDAINVVGVFLRFFMISV